MSTRFARFGGIRSPVNDATTIPRGMTRRRFVQGIASGGIVSALGFWRWPTAASSWRTATLDPPVLSGNHFNLTVERVPVNFTGRRVFATAVNGIVPGPTLRWREGDTVTIAVTNHLRTTTSIHWHGIRTPSGMDGVPGLSFPGIPSGATFSYQFPVRQSGTYWYHGHSGFQEQTGNYGALIIDPMEPHHVEYDREYIVVLSDWTDEDPRTILSNLKQQSNYYNFHQRTVQTFIADVRNKGLGAALADRLQWGRMNMDPTDILDVSGATYTYLLNGNPPAANWTGIFRPRERVLLHFINASSMTIFDVRIPGLSMSVVQADGNDVDPVDVDEFRISVAEVYDVIVQPPDGAAYTIFAQAEDRTGYARGTLAPHSGMRVAVPRMDLRPLRTMADMGMSMGGMKTAEPSAMPGMHMPSTNETPPMKAEAMSAAEMNNPDYAKRAHMIGADAPGQPGPLTSAEFTAPDMGDMAAPIVEQAQLTTGPQIDNLAHDPTAQLSTAGDGFPAGRRVLSYDDLRAVYRGTDPRPPDREIVIHLTGNMERYIWGFDGEKYGDAAPIRLKLGERVRFTLVNDTMMEHPIHLHGLWSELENSNGEFRPYKHTINVKPGEKLSYLVSADTPGEWAFHCHLLYHMESGMFRAVIVS